MSIESPAARKISLARLESPAELRMAAWAQFAHTMIRTMRVIEQFFDANGLTLAQFDVLANLRLYAGLTQQDLAKLLLVTKGNICGLIDRLEKQKWVERRDDPQDRRANRLHITRAGAVIVDRLRPRHDALVGELMVSFSDADVRQFRRFLIRLDESAAKV